MKALRHSRFVSLLAAVLVAASLSAASSAEAYVGLKVGREVPDLMLREAGTKKPLLLSETVDRAKLTVVVFLSPRCSVSNGYADALKELARTFEKRGVRFVGIASGADQQERHVAAHAAYEGFPFPVVFDDGQYAANVFGAVEAPEAFVIDDDRTLIYRGRIDDSYGAPEQASSHDLVEALSAAIRFDRPAQPMTRAEGCGIIR